MFNPIFGFAKVQLIYYNANVCLLNFESAKQAKEHLFFSLDLLYYFFV